MKREHAESVNNIHTFRFPGQRGSATDVVDLPAALQIIMLLPGRAAAKVRLKASVLLVRFLGGDISLVAEIYDMNALQQHLREHWPEHPLARFGEAAGAMPEPDVEANGVATTADTEVSISEPAVQAITRTLLGVFLSKFDELACKLAATHSEWQTKAFERLDEAMRQLQRVPAQPAINPTGPEVIDVEGQPEPDGNKVHGSSPVKVGHFLKSNWCEEWEKQGVDVKHCLLQCSMLLKTRAAKIRGGPKLSVAPCWPLADSWSVRALVHQVFRTPPTITRPRIFL